MCTLITTGGVTLLERLNDTQFRGLVVIVNAILVLLIVRTRFCYEPELPTKPPKPKMTMADVKATSVRVDQKREVYAEYLVRDSRELGVVPPTTVAQMEEPIPYRQSRMLHVLMPDGKKNFVEFAGLRLTVRAANIEGSSRAHMILDVHNTTDTPIAYRVVTVPSKGVQPCTKKRDLGHNAIAVAAGATETRTECVYQSSWGLKIQRIEVMPLHPLAYFYVSQVPPAALGLEARTAAGHIPPSGQKLCQVFLSARNQRALEAGQLTWRDMVDFFARHPCRTYEFPNGYTAAEDGLAGRLPITGR